MNQGIGRTSSEPQKRFDQIKKSVEQKVDKKAWCRRFAGDDRSEAEFFESFSWPGLLESMHAELWPR